VTVTVEGKQLWKNRESPSEVCMWEVSTPQWPSTRITLFKRTRHNAGHKVVTTPVNKKRMNSCVLQNLFLEGVQHQANRQKPGNTLSHAILIHVTRDTNVTFSKFRGLHPKKTALCVVSIHDWITELIRDQTFWELVYFTADEPFTSAKDPCLTWRQHFRKAAARKAFHYKDLTAKKCLIS